MIPCKKKPTAFFTFKFKVSELILNSFILESLKVSKNLPPKFSNSQFLISFLIEAKIIFLFELSSKKINFFLRSFDLSKSVTKVNSVLEKKLLHFEMLKFSSIKDFEN